MKLTCIAVALFVSGANAFSSTDATVKKESTRRLDMAAAMGGTRVISSRGSAARGGSSPVATMPSKALPYRGEVAPPALDGTVPGDVGFDPVFFSAQQKYADYFNTLTTMNPGVNSFTWLREAELMNGRNAMMGVLGMIVPYLFFGKTGNPLDASGADLLPVVFTMGLMEWHRINNIIKEGSNYQPGDMQKWGPSVDGDEGRFNPFGLKYTPEEFEDIQLSEIKHCRTAMVGFLGLYFQAQNSGENIVAQLGNALHSPEYVTKAGYFFPDGI